MATAKVAAKKIAAAKKITTPASKKVASTNGREENYKAITVTPAYARELLDRNDHNRKLDTKYGDYLTREMEQGRWHFDGSPIRVAVDGTLLDGQHRLYAVEKSGLAQKFVVITGLPMKAQTTMDTNKRRTAANVLTLLGHGGGWVTSLAAAARLASAVDDLGLDTERNLNSYIISNPQIVEFIEAHPDLLDCCVEAQRWYRKVDIPSVAVASYALWRMRQIDPDLAAEFWETASEKTNAQAGNPALTMANRFSLARRQKERLDYKTQLSMIFRAWNAYREGKTIVKLPTRRGFETIEIPEPI